MSFSVFQQQLTKHAPKLTNVFRANAFAEPCLSTTRQQLSHNVGGNAFADPFANCSINQGYVNHSTSQYVLEEIKHRNQSTVLSIYQQTLKLKK
jgi:hypothetical protein